MIRGRPGSTRTAILVPYTTRCRSGAGEIVGGERIGDRATADRAGIMPPALAPCLDLAAVDSHPVEQQLQLELRVRLDRTRAAARIGIGRVRPQRLPFGLGHVDAETGPPHPPLRPFGDAAQTRNTVR